MSDLEKVAEEIRQCVLGDNGPTCRVHLNTMRSWANTIEQACKATVALDVSLEKARALHRVWRALNDGDCPKCHEWPSWVESNSDNGFIQCRKCGFYVTGDEVVSMQKLFAPAMDSAVAIFEDWRATASSFGSRKRLSEEVE